MAKVEYPLLVPQAWGGVGKVIIFRRTPAGTVAQSWPSRGSGFTPYSRPQQEIFRQAMLAWKQMKYFKDFVCSINKQAVYDPRGIVGASLFVSRYFQGIYQSKQFIPLCVSDYHIDNDKVIFQFSQQLPCDAIISTGNDYYANSRQFQVPQGSTTIEIPLSDFQSYFSFRLNSDKYFTISGAYKL